MSRTFTSEIKHRRSDRSGQFWIALSFSISAAILAWSFTLPFRGSNDSKLDSGQDALPVRLSPTELAEQRRNRADEFRHAAIALDREFMRSLKKKQTVQASQPKPGTTEVKQHYQRRQRQMAQQVTRFAGAAPGSVEAEYRTDLLRNLEDQDGPE